MKYDKYYALFLEKDIKNVIEKVSIVTEYTHGSKLKLKSSKAEMYL